MTPRQARILVWLVLLPLTVAIWAQFLPPCVFGCAKIQTVAPSPPPRELKTYTVCPFTGPCWEAVGYVVPR
jgi:hypothetical protein